MKVDRKVARIRLLEIGTCWGGLPDHLLNKFSSHQLEMISVDPFLFLAGDDSSARDDR